MGPSLMRRVLFATASSLALAVSPAFGQSFDASQSYERAQVDSTHDQTCLRQRGSVSGSTVTPGACPPIWDENKQSGATTVDPAAVNGVPLGTMTFQSGTGGSTATAPISQRLADVRSITDPDFAGGAKGWPINDTAAIQAALTWLSSGPNRQLTSPFGLFGVDGLDLNGCNKCRLAFGAATLMWTGNAKTFTDSATGVVYPQSVLLVEGDASVNNAGRIEIGGLDGWNLGSRGLFLASGHSHTFQIGSIVYANVGIDDSAHQSDAGDTIFNVGVINYVRTGIYQSPDRLYVAQGLSSWANFTHAEEGQVFNVGFIENFQNYGIKRDAPSYPSSTNQTGSITTDIFRTTAIDATTYYDRTVDPLSTPTPTSAATLGYYLAQAGNTNASGQVVYPPIANAPSTDAPFPGLTRPAGILTKPTTGTSGGPGACSADLPCSIGAIDLRDDYENLSPPSGGTGVTSRAIYETAFLGNSASWLINSGNGGAGLGSRSQLLILGQDYERHGQIVLDPFGGNISGPGTANFGSLQSGTDISLYRHLYSQGSAPGVQSGSCSLSTGANDLYGTLTGTGTSSSCSIHWSAARANPPDCTVSSGTNTPFSLSPAPTTTVLTITSSVVTGAKYTYWCPGA